MPKGYDLAADKWGRLSRTFDTASGFGDLLIGEVDALLRDVTDVLGVPSFIAYGTLLGAVREGTFIGHDTDADISYLSRHDHPADIARESFTLQRGLVDRGWRIHRSATTFLQVWRTQGLHGDKLMVDIFTSYFLGDMFALDCWVRGPLKRADFEPLTEVTLAGRSMPAPARPERLLEATYGPRWRVPDPAFRFTTPRSTTSRVHGYFGRPVVYNALALKEEQILPEPNQPIAATGFAVWTNQVLPSRSRIVSIREGVGSDPIWLATQGHRVLGLDVLVKSRYFDNNRPDLADRLDLERLSLNDLRQCLTRATRLANEGHVATLAVCRLLETLQGRRRENFWLFSQILLSGGGTMLLETGPERSPEEVETELCGHGAAVEARELVAETVGQEMPSSRFVARW